MSNRNFEKILINWGPTVLPNLYEIDIQELLTVLLFLRQNYQRFKGQRIAFEIDNRSDLGAMLRGSSRSDNLMKNRMISLFWLMIADLGQSASIGYIPTKLNVQDIYSRLSDGEMLKAKAESDMNKFVFERFWCTEEIFNIISALEEGVYIRAWFNTI